MTKADFDAKLLSFDKKITDNKTKHLLVQNELNKLKTFDASYLRGQSHFEEEGVQNYLIFQPIIRYFKMDMIISVTDYVLLWKSKDYLPKLLNHLPRLIINNKLLLCCQNKSNICWKLFKTTKNFLHSWKNSKHIYCL